MGRARSTLSIDCKHCFNSMFGGQFRGCYHNPRFSVRLLRHTWERGRPPPGGFCAEACAEFESIDLLVEEEEEGGRGGG